MTTQNMGNTVQIHKKNNTSQQFSTANITGMADKVVCVSVFHTLI